VALCCVPCPSKKIAYLHGENTPLLHLIHKSNFMKKIPVLLGIVIFIACNSNRNETTASSNATKSNNPHQDILNEGSLPSQIFSVDCNNTVRIQTKKGLVFTIPAGAIKSEINPAKIEIKECTTPSEMLLSGLSTNSDKGILSSAGMFLFASAMATPISIVKPISVKAPYSNEAKGMQLYTATSDSVGQRTWVEPTSIALSKEAQLVQRGQALFMTMCNSCHAVNTDATGPALAGVTQRLPLEYIRRFIGNSAAVLQEAYLVQAEMCRWNGASNSDTGISENYFSQNSMRDSTSIPSV
jgi:hypothetical protein